MRSVSKLVKNNILLIAPFIMVICLSIVSWRIQTYLEKEEKREHQQSLSTVLEITQQAIHSWSDEHQATTRIWAESPGVKRCTKKLIAAAIAKKDLSALPLQQELRRLLEPALKREHEVMGEIVTSIAHELNQPLTAIKMYTGAGLVENAKGRIKNDKTASILEKINSQSKRASDVIERNRAMVRRHDTVVEEVDFNKLLSDVEKLVEVSLGMGRCKFDLALSQNVCHVVCAPILLQQVMVSINS